MSRHEIGYFEVARAAEQIFEDGKTPTVALIRRFLGGVLSESTIETHLCAWRVEKEASQKWAFEQLPQELLVLMKTLEHDLRRKIIDQIAAMKAFFQNEIRTLKQDNQRLQQEKMQLKQAKEQLSFENNILESKRYKAEFQNEAFVVQVNELKEAFSHERNIRREWESKYEDIWNKWEEQCKRNSELKSDRVLLQNQVEDLNAALRDTLSTNKRLEQEKWVLGEEKAKLLVKLKQIDSA